MNTRGYVYVLGNAAMPGIYKIGMTVRDPVGRAQQLSQSSGVPTPFEVLAYGECDYPRCVEQDIHTMFDDSRVNPRREFFSLNQHHLWCVIESLHDMCHPVMLSEYAESVRRAFRPATDAGRVGGTATGMH